MAWIELQKCSQTFSFLTRKKVDTLTSWLLRVVCCMLRCSVLYIYLLSTMFTLCGQIVWGEPIQHRSTLGQCCLLDPCDLESAITFDPVRCHFKIMISWYWKCSHFLKCIWAVACRSWFFCCDIVSLARFCKKWVCSVLMPDDIDWVRVPHITRSI